jgi:hypothetical protein
MSKVCLSGIEAIGEVVKENKKSHQADDQGNGVCFKKLIRVRTKLEKTK